MPAYVMTEVPFDLKTNDLSNRVIKRNSFAGFKTDFFAWILIVPALLLIYFFTVRPIFTGIWYSFHRMQGYTILDFCGLDNYARVLSDTRFIQVLANSVKYVVWSLVIGFLLPVFAAIFINEMVHGSQVFRLSVYLPGVMPALVTSLLWQNMYSPTTAGLLNTFLSHFGVEPLGWLQNAKMTIPLIIVSCTWGGFGGTTLLYLASLQNVNTDLYEAATIDGAGFFTRIRKITLPSISNSMLLFFCMQIISTFNIMEQPLAMTGGGPNNASMSLALWSYYNGFISFNTESAIATSVITFLILVVLTGFYHSLEKKIEV